MATQLSAYELARQDTIAKNNAVLASLGLDKPHFTKAKKSLPNSQDAHPEPVERRTTRISSRGAQSSARASVSGNEEEDDDGVASTSKPVRANKTAETTPLTSKPVRAIKTATSKPLHDQATLNAIRGYLEENLPNDAPLVEKSMFGCNCFMARGHIFVALKYDGSRILVRVGKEHMDEAEKLEGASRGPIQCMWVDSPHFKGNDKFTVWYELAAAFNAKQRAKECDEAKPGQKRRRGKQ